MCSRCAPSDQDALTDPSPVSFAFTVDTVAPDTSAKVKDAKGKAVKVVMSSNEDDVKFQCKRGGEWHKCESPKTIKHPGGKDDVLRVRAVDRAKNVDDSPAKVKLKNSGSGERSPSPRLGFRGCRVPAWGYSASRKRKRPPT